MIPTKEQRYNTRGTPEQEMPLSMDKVYLQTSLKESSSNPFYASHD